MSQYLRPVEDISVGGSGVDCWPEGAGSLYAVLNETTPSDSNGVWEGGTSTAGNFEVKLGGTLTDPGVGTGHYVKVRHWKESTSGDATTVTLKQGSTTIATWTLAEPTSATTTTLTLTETQANSITDYTDLRVYCVLDGANTAYSYISWIEFGCPDAPAVSGLEMGMMF